VKLTKGKGTPETGGCWMVAASMYATGTWDDQPACVPPTLRTMCVLLNDMCSDGEREELLGPHLFAPLGRDASLEAELQRAHLCADWAVRRYALGTAINAWARKWLSGEDRSRAAADAAATSAVRAAGAEAASRAAAEAAEEAARASRAATAAEASAWAAVAGAGDKQALLDLILECCEVGDNPPQELDPAKVHEVMRVVCKEEA